MDFMSFFQRAFDFGEMVVTGNWRGDWDSTKYNADLLDEAEDAFRSGNITREEREVYDHEAGYGKGDGVRINDFSDIEAGAKGFDRELNEARDFKEETSLFGV